MLDEQIIKNESFKIENLEINKIVITETVDETITTINSENCENINNEKKLTKKEDENVKNEYIPDNWFFLQIGKYVLEADEEKNNIKIGSKAIISELNKKMKFNQLWLYEDEYIIHKKSGLVLEIKNNKIFSGASILLGNKDHENCCQKWKITSNGVIYNKTHIDFVLGIEENNIPEGAELVVYKTNKYNIVQNSWIFFIPIKNHTSERIITFKEKEDIEIIEWNKKDKYSKNIKLNNAKIPDTYFYFIINSEFVLEVDQSHQSARSGSDVIIAPIKKDTLCFNQFWIYENNYIIHKKSQTVLSIKEKKIEENTKIEVQKKQNDVNYQKFIITNDGYIAIKSNINLVLTIDGNIEKGSQIKIIDKNKINKELSQWRIHLAIDKKTQNPINPLKEHIKIDTKKWEL